VCHPIENPFVATFGIAKFQYIFASLTNSCQGKVSRSSLIGDSHPFDLPAAPRRN
jgi:hypothetical protein